MAPESNTPENAQRTAPSGQTVSVPTPAEGAAVTVVSSPGGELELGFDPGAATATRSENSLVFELDGGGTVTITDFFVVGDESLPNLKLPDGTVVASAEFFEGSDLDMTTAAGPGAGAPGSGGTNYSDDPGALLNGLDKYGKLGTDYWGRETEYGEEYQGLINPSGTFSFGVSTGEEGNDDGQGFKFILGAYEDGQPRQHVESLVSGHDGLGMLDGRTFAPAHIQFYPEPGTGTTIGEILFWGLPEGTTLYVADGDSPTGYSLITPDANGVYHFSEADFVNPGVYLVPPANSDNDFNFSASVELVAPGGTITVPGTVNVVVDAVADMPMDLAADMGNAEFGGESMGVEERQTTQEFEKGKAVDTITTNVDGNTSADGVELSVPFSGNVTFYDFEDDSERHYILVEVPSKDNVNPETFLDGNEVGTWRFELSEESKELGLKHDGTIIRLWYDADGNVVGETGQDVSSFDGAEGHRDFFQISVPNEIIPDGTEPGSIEGLVEVSGNLISGDSDITQDTSFELSTGAKAAEEVINQGELDYDNNVSYTFGEDGSGLNTVLVDVVDAKLTVTVGWTSEGQAPGKYLGPDETPRAADYDGHAIAPDSFDAAYGAPINVELGTSKNSGDFLTSVTFVPKWADNGQNPDGTFLFKGEKLAAGEHVVNGVTITVSYENGGVTITLADGQTLSDLSGLGLTYQPCTDQENPNYYKDGEVSLDYTVNTGNGAGASGTYTGKTTAVIDAVADFTPVEASMDTTAGDLVQVGEGDDYAKIQAEGAVGTERGDTSGTGGADNGPNAATGWETDDYDKTYESAVYTVKVRVEAEFKDTDSSEKHYILIEQPSEGWTLDTDNLPEGFAWDGTFYVDDSTEPPTRYFQIDVSGITNGPDAKAISEEIPLKVTVTAESDGSINEIHQEIKTGTIAEEQADHQFTPDGNMEYNTADNIAVNIDNAGVTYKVDVINSHLQVKTGWASEGNSDAKHIGKADGSGYSRTNNGDVTPDFDAASTSESGKLNNGAPITIALTDVGTDPATGAANEFITKATISAPANRGSFFFVDAEGVAHALEDGGSFGDEATVLYTFSYNAETGAWTITVSGADAGTVTSLDGLNLVFQPTTDPTNPNYYNDADVELTYTVTVENGSGASATFGDKSTIVIDAVADRSAKVESALVGDGAGLETGDGSFTKTVNEQSDGEGAAKDGWLVQEFNADGAGLSYEISVKVETQFFDLDGSEAHYVLIQNNSEADGPQWNLTAEALNAANPGANFTDADIVRYEGSDGNVYFAVNVSGITKNGDGTVSLEVPLTVTDVEGDLTEVTINTGSVAVEQDGVNNVAGDDNALKGLEYDTGNNLAERLGDNDGHKYEINVINSKLTVKAGWASESNNDAKHLGLESSGYEYNFANMTEAEREEWEGDPGLAKENTKYGKDIDAGAPVQISIDGASGEYISSVTLSLPKGYTADANGVIYDASGEALGTLFQGGTALVPVLDPVSGQYTIQVPGAGAGVTDVDLLFVPNKDGFNQNDIPLQYEVAVTDAEGVTAVAKGETAIVIDAVADKAVISGLETQYATDANTGWEQTAAKPEQDVTLKATVRFPDTTEGNETHTIQIAALENGKGDSADIKSVTITGVDGEGNDVTLYFVMVDGKLVQYDGPDGQPVEGGTVVLADGNGAYNIDVDETVGTCNVTIKASGDAAEDTNGLKLDTNYEIAVNGISEVNVPEGDAEYDLNNNTALTPGKVGFEVAPNNTDDMKGIDVKNTHESTNGTWNGVDPNAHGTTTNEIGGDTYKRVSAKTDADGNIKFEIDQPAASASNSVEQIYSVKFTVEGELSDQGSLWIKVGGNWQPVTEADGFTFETVGGNTVVTYTAPGKGALDTSLTVKYVGNSHNDKDLTILDSEVVLVNSKSLEQSDPIKADYTEGGSDGKLLIVDEVANRPGFTGNVTTYTSDEETTQNGAEEPAYGGEKVSATLTVTFSDLDGSEQHFILVQDMSAQGFSYKGCTVTVNGTTYLLSELGTITVNGQTYFKAPVPNGADGKQVGSVNVTVEMITPESYGDDVTTNDNGAHTYNPKVGGLAVETDNDQGTTNFNDAAVNLKDVPVVVDLVDAKVAVTVGSTFENGRANGHIFQERGEITGEGQAGDAAHVYKYGERAGLSSDGRTIDTVAEYKAVGAEINVNLTSGHGKDGAADGSESIARAIFQISAGSEPTTAPNQFMYKGVLVPVPTPDAFPAIDGDAVTCELVNTGTEQNPNWVVKITIEGFDEQDASGDSSLYFIPGNNHDSGELELDYAITVRDGDTGQERVYASDEALGKEALDAAEGPNPQGGGVSEAPVITVDSVAEAALIDTNPTAGVDGSEYVAPGGVAEIGMTITVLDAHDGSEQQFVFVEEISGWDVESLTIGGNTYPIAYLEEHGLITRQTIDLGDGEPRAYWKITLPEHEVTGKGDNLELDVTVRVQTDGSTNTTVHTGTGSQEKFLPGENNDIYEDRPEGDVWEGTFNNNTSFRPGDGVEVKFDPTYYSKPGLDVPKGYYEHGAGDPVGAFGEGRCVLIDLNVGTGNVITSITITETSGENGTLYFFDDADKRGAFEEAYNDAVKTGGELPNPLDPAFGGREVTGTIEAGEGKNLNGGGFVFLPDPDSHKDGDFSFKYEMDYTNTNTGTNETAKGSGSLIGDAVAQYADELGNSGVLDSEGKAVDLEDMRYNSFDKDGKPDHVYKTELKATFFDVTDDSSEHFMLIEAEANWAFRYEAEDGTVYSSDGADGTVAMEVYVHTDGTHYYMIPVTPGDDGKASAEVEMIPPKYNMAIEGSGSIQTGALSREVDAEVGNELNWNNNQAAIIDGGIDYNLGRGPGYGPEVGITGLYEDNRPDAYKELDAKEEPGTLHIDQPAGADSVVITFPGGSDAIAEICYQDGDNWVSIPANGSHVFDGGYTVTNNGDGTYTVTGLNGSGSAAAQIPVRVTDNWSNDDKDFPVDYQYKNGADNVGEKQSFDAVVDAVADLADFKGVEDDTNAQGDVNHAAGASKLTSISVEVEFDDVSDGSENRYILVEKSSDWAPVGDYTTVYHEGTAYYCIDVTGVPLVDGKLSYDVPIEYKGSAKDYDEGELGIRIMTQEKNFGDPNGDMEISTENNTSVTDEITATVAYSRATSTLTVTVGDGTGKDQVEYSTALVNENGDPYTGGTPHVVNAEGQIVEAEGADLGWPVSISINYDGNDELLDISFSNIPEGSFLFVNGNKVDTSKPLSEQLEALGLDSVDDIESANVTYRPGQFEHHDQTFTWNATFKDELSGDQATSSGNTSVVIDAHANGSDNEREMTDTSGKWTAVKSGENAVIAVDADFIDESEDLFVVLEQKLGYDLVGIKVYDTSTTPPTELTFDLSDVVTKYGMDGETYYAIKVDKDVRVEFEIKTQPQTVDTNEPSLKAGTITVVPDADKEYSLGNNWTENIDQVAIKTGVVTTEGVSFTMGTLTENDPTGAAITMSEASQQALSDNNEVVGDLTFHFNMPGASGAVTIMYGDQAYEITFTNGNAVWSVPTPPAFNPDADLRIIWGTNDEGGFKPNHSGTGNMTVHTEGTIVDSGSGDTAGFDKGLAGTMPYVPMPDPGTTPEVKGEVDDPSKISGQHKASVDVVFNTEFVDTDGSEEHALVFLAPKGMSVDGASTLSAQEISDMKLPPLAEGENYYKLTLSGTDTKADHTVKFIVDDTYQGGEVVSYAVSEEGRNQGKYNVSEVSDPITITKPGSLNEAPEAIVGASGKGTFGATLTTPVLANQTINLKTLFSDNENDGILLTGVQFGDGTKVEIPSTGSITVNGLYGVLTINANGTYSYALNEGVSVSKGAVESFTLWAKDSYGADAKGASKLDITFGATVNTGSAGDDSITGTDGAEVIYGMTGSDTIDAGAGNDTIYAGDGNNLIYAGAGTDKVTSGAGNDTIYTGDGNDTVNAGNGANQVFIDGSGNKNITTGTGADYIKIAEGADGNSTINAGNGNNTVDIYGDGINKVTTGNGADSVDIHGDGNNNINTGTGNDVVHVYGDGNNTINLGAGNDTVYISGDGDNTLTFNSGLNLADLNEATGNNVVYGGTQADTIYGGGGHDKLYAGAGNDIIYTGGGNNLVYGGAGSDIMHSGSGENTFAWNASDITNNATDSIVNFKFGHDLLQFDGGSVDDYIKGIEFTSASKVTLTVGKGSASQSIEVNFTDNEAVREMYDTYQEYQSQSNTEASDALLAHLINTLTNNS